jgi:hypothetical protein
MTTFLLTIIIIMLALGLVSYVSSKRSVHSNEEGSALSLLPGDIKYESPSGQIHFLFSDNDLDSRKHCPGFGPLSFALGRVAALKSRGRGEGPTRR